jgi:hypothetical protein
MKAGGPAFPNEGFNGWGKPQEGMTLRDYFAAKAMQSWLVGVDDPCTESCAKLAYKVADAMLKAREQ